MEPINWSGYLFSHPKGENAQSLVEEKFSSADEKGFGLVKTGRHFHDLGQWHLYNFKTTKALMGEDKYDLPIKGPYEYKLIFVFSGCRVIVLAQRKTIVSYVQSNILGTTIYPNLREVKINLDGFVESCVPVNSRYRVTSLYGRVATSKSDVKSISLRGNNVTDSDIYKTHGRYFNYISCGIGHNTRNDLPIIDTQDENEIVIVGNDGFIHSKIQNADKAKDLLKIIGHIVANKWIDSSLIFK
ncbi:MAG: hypothetical protein ABJN22_04835 [Litorimonas sp.]